ncbi:O-antigen ligase domain-containing protein [Zoogloea oleivorans]|uniref:O-antigen ligase domain-containing protein n=1 Tax=Zoogloea oleivorans TaxID=1552750 RepID=A0A6C2CCW3_9RHOO|nr:O-antigen ligase family protein [Zoogloea oleivorans]TYC51814.1 O-antigen ligase domain-containing protein [Zoogloea oleivorans]
MDVRDRARSFGAAKMMVSFAGRICLCIYIVIGLGLSGVEAVSRFAAFAALFGVVLYFATYRKVPKGLGAYLFVLGYFSLSWFWAKEAAVGVLGNYLSAVLGGLLLFLALRAKWVSPAQAVLLLLLPFFLNLYAYIIGDNLTSSLFDIEEDAAFKRFGGYVGHPNALVTRLIAPLVVLAFLVSYIRRKSVVLLLLSLSLASAFFAIYSSGSKKSILLMLPPLVMMGLFFFRKEDGKSESGGGGVKNLGFILFLVVSVVVGANFSTDEIEVFSRFESFFSGSDESTDERRLLVLIAPSLIVDAPMFGHGLDQYAIVSGVGFYSHNNYVEALVNTGVVGFFLYYFVFLDKLNQLRRQRSGIFLSLLCIVLFVSLDVTGVTYGDRGSQIMLMAFFFRAVTGERAVGRVYG